MNRSQRIIESLGPCLENQPDRFTGMEGDIALSGLDKGRNPLQVRPLKSTTLPRSGSIPHSKADAESTVLNHMRSGEWQKRMADGSATKRAIRDHLRSQGLHYQEAGVDSILGRLRRQGLVDRVDNGAGKLCWGPCPPVTSPEP